MTILVVGGTGTVGSRTVEALRSRGEDVRVMTRAPEKAKERLSGVEAVAGDLSDPGSLPPVFAGAERLFLITPLSRTETEQGLAAVEAAKTAGVARIVYMTIHRLEEGAHIPHFASKIPVVRALRESGIPYTLIEPNNFFQNDEWFAEAIIGAGVYPQPLGGIGVSRVDARDIAEAAARVLCESGHEGKAYPLVGPEALTGERVAEIYAQALGREVRYGGDDVEAWAAEAQKMMPEWLAHDLAIMYRYFQEKGLAASDAELAACREVLGGEPRTLSAYAAEAVAQWTA